MPPYNRVCLLFFLSTALDSCKFLEVLELYTEVAGGRTCIMRNWWHLTATHQLGFKFCIFSTSLPLAAQLDLELGWRWWHKHLHWEWGMVPARWRYLSSSLCNVQLSKKQRKKWESWILSWTFQQQNLFDNTSKMCILEERENLTWRERSKFPLFSLLEFKALCAPSLLGVCTFPGDCQCTNAPHNRLNNHNHNHLSQNNHKPLDSRQIRNLDFWPWQYVCQRFSHF